MKVHDRHSITDVLVRSYNGHASDAICSYSESEVYTTIIRKSLQRVVQHVSFTARLFLFTGQSTNKTENPPPMVRFPTHYCRRAYRIRTSGRWVSGKTRTDEDYYFEYAIWMWCYTTQTLIILSMYMIQICEIIFLNVWMPKSIFWTIVLADVRVKHCKPLTYTHFS